LENIGCVRSKWQTSFFQKNPFFFGAIQSAGKLGPRFRPFLFGNCEMGSGLSLEQFLRLTPTFLFSGLQGGGQVLIFFPPHPLVLRSHPPNCNTLNFFLATIWRGLVTPSPTEPALYGAVTVSSTCFFSDLSMRILKHVGKPAVGVSSGGTFSISFFFLGVSFEGRRKFAGPLAFGSSFGRKGKASCYVCLVLSFKYLPNN